MFEKNNLNNLKEDFKLTKNQLENMLKENNKMKNILNDFFEVKTPFYKIHKEEEFKNIKMNNELNNIKNINENNEENFNLYKEELKKIKSGLFLLKNAKYENNNLKNLKIEKNFNNNLFANNNINSTFNNENLYNNLLSKNGNNSESRINFDNKIINNYNIRSESKKYENTDIILKNKEDEENNLNDENLNEVLGIFTSFGLNKKELEEIFLFYFKDKNELFSLIKSKNYNLVISKLLKIILDSHKINKLDIVRKNEQNLIKEESYKEKNHTPNKSPKKIENNKFNEKRNQKKINKIKNKINDSKNSDDYISFNNDKNKSKNYMKPKFIKELVPKKNILNKSESSNINNKFTRKYKKKDDKTNLFKFKCLKPKSPLSKNNLKKYSSNKNLGNSLRNNLNVWKNLKDKNSKNNDNLG